MVVGGTLGVCVNVVRTCVCVFCYGSRSMYFIATLYVQTPPCCLFNIGVNYFSRVVGESSHSAVSIVFRYIPVFIH